MPHSSLFAFVILTKDLLALYQVDQGACHGKEAEVGWMAVVYRPFIAAKGGQGRSIHHVHDRVLLQACSLRI